MKYFSLEIVPVSTYLWAEERNKGRPSHYDNNVKKVQHSWSQVGSAAPSPTPWQPTLDGGVRDKHLLG